MKRILAEALIIAGGVALGGLAVLYGLPLVQDRYEGPQSQAASMGRSIATMLQKEPLSAALADLYHQRDWRPFWLKSDGTLSPDGQKVQLLVATAAEQGLPAARYKLPPAPQAQAAPASLARYDIALSGAALRYARDMEQGLLQPADLFDDAEGDAPDKTLPQELAKSASDGNAATFLAGLEPGGDYPRLKAALKLYRSAPEWPLVEGLKAKKAPLPAGLAPRLAAEGYLAKEMPQPGELEAALKQWQTVNGLEPDGKLGADTLAALNISRRTRAAQIAVNMERWRWLPRKLPDRYIWVSVPSAQLVLIENRQPVLVSRVVVGAPDKQTPLFVTRAVAVTINPRWHIPKSIIENELKPKLAANPGYLEARDIIEEDGRLVQMPGPQNALGAIKIELPNHFDVYLHDTPSKKAFLSDERALSHGCIRVQAIRELAMKLVGMEPDELDTKIAGRETTRKPLREAIPVFIQYWTAVPSPTGRFGFREDVYRRDARMIAALEKLDV